MKFPRLHPNRQSYLTGFLLLALAANISWQPEVRNLMKTNLASEALATGGATSATATRASESDSAPRTPSPRALTVADGGPKPDAPLRLNATPQTSLVEFTTICDVAFRIEFREVEEQGRKKTRISVNQRFSDTAGFGFEEQGTIEQVVGNPNSKAQLDSHISKRAQASLGEKCRNGIPQSSVASSTQQSETATSNAKPVAANSKSDEEQQKQKDRAAELEREREKERKRAEARVKREKERRDLCEIDEDGRRIKSEDRIQCVEDKLSDLASADLDSREDREKALRRLDSLLKGEVRRDLRELYRSGEPESIREADDSIRRISAELLSLQREHRLDQRRVIGLIDSLRAIRTSSIIQDRVESVKDDTWAFAEEVRATREILNQNPLDPSANFQMNTLIAQHRQRLDQFNLEFVTNHERAMRQMQARKLITDDELSEFLQPYQKTQRVMTRMFDPRLAVLLNSDSGTDPSVGTLATPNDLVSFRTRLSTSGGRHNGIRLPARPNLSIGNYGLSHSNLQFNLGPQASGSSARPAATAPQHPMMSRSGHPGARQ